MILLAAGLALTAHAGGDASDIFLADSMNLTVAKGALASDTVLSWSGGPAPYWVHRANTASNVLVPANLITSTSSSSYSDSGSPAPGGAFFFQVVNQWPLTLDKSGPGAITRGGASACNPSCPETTWHDNGTVVTLVATPVNASGYYFSGWSGACSGPSHTCNVTMTQARSVTANFSPIVSNLAFVSSTAFAANLGGTAPYDAQCNTLATAAGINNVTSSAFIAWLSDLNSNAKLRLGATTRGWIRLDGKPFADTQLSLFTNSVLYHPLRLDESGFDAGSQPVMTGTLADGSTGNSCSNWTGSGNQTTGNSAFGPGGWTNWGGIACSTTARIYCLMKTSTAALTLTPEAGKRIYLSSAVTPGGGLPAFDNRCATDKPPGTGTVRALVATSSASALSRLLPGQRYVRPDGVFVASTADLSSGALLTSGIWQDGAGAYLANQAVWTGATSPGVFGTAATTCNSWVSSSGSAITGLDHTTDMQWWNYSASTSCSSTFVRLYCVEQ
jgi:uncharacterized repeat protein (TIGR02543 family)